MPRTGTTLGIAALAMLATGTHSPAHATGARTPARESGRARPLSATLRTAEDGKLSLRDGSVLTRVLDAKTGAPIAGALAHETAESFGLQAQGYRELRIALAPSVARSRERRELPDIVLCQLGASDADGDGLCDDAERRYRTDPSQPDSDGDAISDAVEMYGDKLPDGTLFDLRAEGASPTQKDVFVRMDWTPNRAPSDESVRMVTEAFAAAPATKPDLTPGIKLHLKRGQEIPSQGDFGLTPEAIQSVRSQYFKQTYSFPFHYVVFTDFLQGHDASGISPEIPGLNFVVSLGVIKQVTPLKEAGTIMHELGHNLGLQHGGDEGENNKPNYLSVMNYLYQFDGLQRAPGKQGARMLDYARFATQELDEHNLDERVGFKAVGADGSSFTSYNPFYLRCPPGVIRRLLGCSTPKLNGQFPGAIDFNGVRGPVDTRVSVDLNGNHKRDTFRAGINDWETLKFSGLPDPNIMRVVSTSEDADPTCPVPPDDAIVATEEDSVPPPLDDAPIDPGPTEPAPVPGNDTPTPGPETTDGPIESDPGPGLPSTGDGEPQGNEPGDFSAR